MKPRIRTLVLLLLICAIGTGPAQAFNDVEVRIDSIQPLAGNDFVILVEGTADAAPVTVEEVVRTDQGLEVRLARPACDGPTCVARGFRLEIPIDASTEPFEEGLVELAINGRVGVDTERSSLFWSYFAIGPRFYHSMQPEIVLNPLVPTDQDRLQILVPVVANVCGPWTPFLDRIERQGSLISVFLRFNPGFGGDLATGGEIPTKCSPAVPILGVTPVDLGALKAGSYNLHLYFESTRDDALPLRVNLREFEVLDEPDVVGLQNGRFNVELEWTDADGSRGVGEPVPGRTSDSTLFTFFGPENWEILVKVLDGCAINDRFWVFGAAATDVEYTITVTDTWTNEVWSYTNPLGNASAAINATDAFATCGASEP